jgi:hypothetical protein
MDKWYSMSPGERCVTLLNMRDKGSPFVQTLAQALVLADVYNEDKIVKAFPEIVARYAPKEGL